MNDKPLLEACVETFEEAISAEKKDADRLELCSHLDVDGLTPDEDLVRKTVTDLTIPVKVMIRPRDGNFIYTESEIDEMKSSIKFCKNLKVQGVVFGVLDEKNNLNLRQIKMLADFASPLKVTIHKAIDLTTDLQNAVEELRKIENITSILTSGGAQTAIEGKEMLRKMIQLSGISLKIIPAGKITKANLSQIHQAIGAEEYHGRRIVD